MVLPEDADTVERLLAEDGDMVVVESKMERGSTHNKDRTTYTAAVSKDDFAEELGNLRDAQKADMIDRARFDPEDHTEDD